MRRRKRREAAILKRAAEGGGVPTGSFAKKLLARKATSQPKGTETSILARIKAIKAVDDYDENDSLVKELKGLRSQLKELQNQKSSQSSEKEIAKVTARMKEIKAVDDYDEDDKLVSELKKLRARLRELREGGAAAAAAAAATAAAAAKARAAAEAAAKKLAARKAKLQARVREIKKVEDYDEKPKLMAELKKCRNELREIGGETTSAASSPAPQRSPAASATRTPRTIPRGQQIFFRNIPRDPSGIQSLTQLFSAGSCHWIFCVHCPQFDLNLCLCSVDATVYLVWLVSWVLWCPGQCF